MSDDMSMGLPSSAGEHGVLRSMQEVAMSSQEASKMLRTYNIAWWGNNYYDVNELGHISVCPDPDVPEARVDLAQLVKLVKHRVSVCLHCSVSHRSCSTVCVPLTPRSNVRGNPTAITAITSLFIRSKLTSTVA